MPAPCVTFSPMSGGGGALSQSSAQPLERGEGRLINAPVDPVGTKMALEGLDHELGARIEAARRLDAVAVVRQPFLYGSDQRSGCVASDTGIGPVHRRRRHPG